MRPLDTALAVLVSVVWGCAFIATKVGLESFTPAQLTALRVLLACLPAVLLPKPQLPWSSLLMIGLTLFAGQFLLLFFAMKLGLPPGVASITQQTQVFFTVILAALFLHEKPTSRQSVGLGVSVTGLVLIGATVGTDLTLIGLALGLGSALSWAGGVDRRAEMPSHTAHPAVLWF